MLEDFKLGVLKDFGLCFDSLSEPNPGLVYCSITGFGQTGPDAHRAGYDYLAQGMSRLVSIFGDPSGASQKVRFAILEIYTALYVGVAVQAGLMQRMTAGQGSAST